ncbi:LysR family transcriptional regulator [Novosphingobium resinovorum]|jgi:DNA-binding transcriptional LysR family regulator|uniref:LysR family transcriptional regulator n=1 Tax=Novosphingobium TaxID=165696 RepID=UPI00055DE5E4|nr:MULTISPECIES: LysR family transcriptional regulator [Novosphingobium]WJM25179.1 LysR family transcriptional regulator [Novosphingobium resinovorum]
MRIDPRLLIEFAAVAEEASFTKAAERLRIAQPWLSARIKKLETMLGFGLIDRTTRHVALTQRGRTFLEAARAVTIASEAANALAQNLRHRERVGSRPPFESRVEPE